MFLVSKSAVGVRVHIVAICEPIALQILQRY
jgi:hypothetical protein